MDMTANKTMRKLDRMYPINADTPEGKEIRELLDGMEMPMTNDNLMLAMFGYMLGMSRKNRKEVTRA